MAKFSCEFQDPAGGYFYAMKENGDALSVDDLLEVLRPAGLKLKDYYKRAILAKFKRRTGSLAESIDIEDNDIASLGYASITVKPFGKHKGGKYTRRSRAGSSSRRYAKHNRQPSTKALKNEELAYLLEYGTPRIAASHWMENTNEQVAEEIQNIVEDGFTDLLKRKGLI